MKQIIVFLMLVLSFTDTLVAQESEYDKSYRFVYIAHDVSTPIDRLSEELSTKYREAIQYDNVVIFYLSNGYESMVINVNTPEGDNRSNFDKNLMSELQEYNSHDVEAEIDVNKILEAIAANDFVDEFGNIKYSSVDLDFYVGSLFWTLGNNESILAELYFSLDIPRYHNKVSFNVFCNAEDELTYQEGLPFGNKNVSEINEKVSIYKY